MDTHRPSNTPASGTSTGATPGSSATPGNDSMRGALDDAKRHVDAMTDDVKQTAADIAQQARDAASQAASEGARKASRFAEAQKGLAADQITKVSEAAHAAADHLNETSPQMARYAHELASGIDRFAGRVRERSVGDLVQQASSYARRDPAIFMAGTVLVGFMLTRFLKSSAERAERARGYGMGQGADGGREYGGGFGRDYGDDRERRMGTGGADRFRNATQGMGSMPGAAGSGRSYDPTPRYDERDAAPGQGGGGAMRSASGTGSGTGMGSGTGRGSGTGASGSGASSPDGLTSTAGAKPSGAGGRDFTGGTAGVGSGGAGGSTVRPGSTGENVQPDLTRGGSHG